MDFLSDTTKKERRNLLAAGFAGIIVAQLKIYPTEIDLVGLKFNSPELPLIVVGALTLAITYSWVKFLSSYLYERSYSETQNLFTQIHNGEIKMDVSKKEQELSDWARQLIDRRKVLQGRIEHENMRLSAQGEKYNSDSDEYKESIRALDLEESELQKERAQLVRQRPTYPLQAYIVRPGEKTADERLMAATQRRIELVQKNEANLKTKREDLEQERKNIMQMHEQEESDIKKNEEIAIARNNTILEWKKAHKTETIISPLHRFLELYLPLAVGLIAIVSLSWLVFHFPEPTPPSLPNF